MTRMITPLRPSRPTRPAHPEMAMVARNIGRFGMHLVHVGERCHCRGCLAAPAPPNQRFGYTVGLTDRGHPELVVRGLGSRETAEVLARWGSAVLSGDALDAGHLLCEGPTGVTWELVPVGRAPEVLAWAARYYRLSARRLSALELIPARRPCLCEGCG